MFTSRQHRLAEVLFSIYDIVARTDEAVAPVLEQHSLTRSTAHLLWVIDPGEDPPSMKTVAERMHCAASNVTFLCQQLEARELVNRAPSPSDRRQRVVHLTDAGRDARTEVVKNVSSSSPLAGLSDEALRSLANELSL